MLMGDEIRVKYRNNVVFSSQIDDYYTIVKGLRGIIMSTENVTQFVELNCCLINLINKVELMIW